MANRKALIVATGSYQDPKLSQLRAPAADADRLADVLRDPSIGDFEVDIAIDDDERSLRRRLARFFAAADRDDVVLAHFSCHGVKDANGALYLAASDTEMDLLEATAIPAAWLDEQLTRSPSRRKLLLLDCCFSGKFPFDSVARGNESVEVHERFQGRGRAIITASNAMEYAYEGDRLTGSGQPSYFTAAIVEALRTGEADRDQDAWISVDELYDYIFDRVTEASPQQTPTKQIALEGPLYVAHSNFRRPLVPAKLDEQLLLLTENPVAAARLGAVEELALLQASNRPEMALAARNALQQMCDDDSKRVSERARAALREHADPRVSTRTHDIESEVKQPEAMTGVRELSEPARRLRLRAGDLLASASGLVLLISAFLPWYHYNGTGYFDSTADTAIHEWPKLPTWCLFITAVAALGLLAVPLLTRTPIVARRLRMVVTGLGGISLLLVIYLGLVSYPHSSYEQANKYGVVVGLIGAAGVVSGGFLSLRSDRRQP